MSVLPGNEGINVSKGVDICKKSSNSLIPAVPLLEK